MYALLEAAFKDEASAYRFVEERVWPQGPVCPHCGGAERIGRMNGKTTRMGSYKCYACRKPFTVKIGTVWEDSHVPLHLWLQAIYLLCTTRTSISISGLQRALGVTLITASLMAERINAALEAGHVLLPDATGGHALDAVEDDHGTEKPLPKAKQLVQKIRARALSERHQTSAGGSADERLQVNLPADVLPPATETLSLIPPAAGMRLELKPLAIDGSPLG